MWQIVCKVARSPIVREVFVSVLLTVAGQVARQQMRKR